MPRERDPFWRHVTLLNKKNSKWKCNFCRQVNSGGATRIKAHLAGITRYGIKGCEGVDVDVKAEAREVLMPKKVMDSSDQGVPEERIEGNVRVAPTSTSNPPNVEGGTNLQSAQGAPLLTPQTHGLMEGVVQAEGEVHIANLPWAGATSYPSASPLSESFFPTPDELSTLFTESFGLETLNAQQNPCAPLPSQNRQLLDNTFQNKSQGSILLASDTQLTTMATIYTPRQSNQPHQSFHRQCGHGTGVTPPRDSMNIGPLFPSLSFNEPLISEPFNSPPQIPGDIIDTMSPSTLEGVPPSTPQTRMDQRVQEDRLVYIASLLLDGATSSSSASPRLNSFPPNISQSLTLDAQQKPTAPSPSQNCPLLANTSQNESRGSILPGPIESNTQLTNMATTNAPQHSNQTHQSFHRQGGCGSGLSPPRDSMDREPPIPSQPGPSIIEPWNSPPQIPEDIINTTGPSTSEGNSNLDCNQPRISSVTSVTNSVPHSNQQLPSCNEEWGTETSSFPMRDSRGICPVTALRPTRCPHIEATLVNLVLENGANMAGPSPPQAYLLDSPYQRQCSTRSPYPEEMQMNEQQTPTGASLSQYHQLLAVGNSNCLQDSNQQSQLQIPMDMDPSTALQHTTDFHIFEATIIDSQVPEAATDTGGLSSSQASVPPHPQSVPHQSINHETRNEQQNPTMPSSSCKIHLVTCPPTTRMDMDPHILSSSQAPNNGPPFPQIPPCRMGPVDPGSLPDMNTDAPITSHPNTGNNSEEIGALKRKLKRLYSREHDIREGLEYGASLSLKKPRTEAMNWLADVGKLRNDFAFTEAASEDCLPPHQQVVIVMREVEDLMRHGNFPNGLFEATETKVSKLLEGKMVGEAFKRNTTKILECLAENQVSQLGIYGMGGVGKTTTMVHIHNILIEKANYDNVLWVTVSQDFNTQKLQEDIWKKLELDTPQEMDVRQGAAMLSNGLMKRGKSIIILDDVWEYFNLEEVGIPARANGIKLILTTRSYDVCCQMHCQENIKIEPLSHKEARSLFLEELGSKEGLNSKIEAVMDSIVKECEGLPLGLITMARSMRGVTDMFEWRDSLVNLKESSMGQTDMENKVLMNLKFSYDRLKNPYVQQCFLSCALYPEDKLIDKFELVEFFIEQGLIGGLNRRKEQYDRGLTILNKLGNVCLLEDYGKRMKMHDLIRDMALHIMSATSIVKAGKQLGNIPPEEYWTDALEKVSLMENEISEIPLNMSPNCPKLSTLLLNGSFLEDVVIPNSFFEQLRGLKVLNLSECDLRELPNSISDLVNLRALLLRECRKLHRIPYLGKLTSLRKLDAKNCQSLEALEGLEKLVNLRYLNLTKTCIERLPKGTLDRLLYLQCLKVSAVVEDITKLGALETFSCYPKNVDDFNKCVRVIEQSDLGYYKLNVEKSKFIAEVSDDTRFGNLGRRVDIRKWAPAIVSVGGECTSIYILIPRDVQTMTMTKCDGITNLSSMGLLECLEELTIEESKNLGVLFGGQDKEIIDIHDSPAAAPTLLFSSLRVLEIRKCPKLKYLFGHGSISNLPHLQSIEIEGCKEMVGMIAAVTSPPPHPLPFFPSLENILVYSCNKMKRAVESEWMPHFPNLRSITVIKCEKMEEIIRGPPPYLPVEEISLESLQVEIEECENLRVLCGRQDEEVFDIHDSLAPTPTLPLFLKLRVCICKCPKLKYIFGHGYKSNLPHLRELQISQCEEMLGIIAGVTSPPPHSLPLFPSLKVILVDRCNKMKRAVESEWMPHFPNLRRIKVVSCKMEEIIGGPLSYVPVEEISLKSLQVEIEECENLRVFCGGQDGEVIDIHDSLASTPTLPLFLKLRVLSICKCPKLKYLFGHGSKSNLPFLQELQISQCEEMVGIIAAVTSPPPHLLPFFPSLEEICVEYCHKMKRAVESEWMPNFPNLRQIIVVKCEKMEEIIRGPPPYVPVEEISLESLQVEGCNNMRKLFLHEWLLHLRNLQNIEVLCCKGMVEMTSRVGQGQEGSTMTPVNNTPSSFRPPISLPKLEQLAVLHLPQLKSICEVPISCDSMKFLNVDKCPELKGIPLQLRLRDIEKLPYIRVEDEEKWKTLMWDHLDAQAILQPFLRKEEHANDRPWTPPPNVIELSTKRKDPLQRHS